MHYLACLPQMSAFMSGHRGEPGSEGHVHPRHERRPDARAREVEAVRLPETIDVLHLVGAEGCHDFAARPATRRLKSGGRLGAKGRRRLQRSHEHPCQPPVSERSVRVRSLADGVRDPFIELRKIHARGDVQMIDALPDRPRVRRGTPVELLVGESRCEQVGFIGEPLELLPELVDLRCECEDRCRHPLRL